MASINTNSSAMAAVRALNTISKDLSSTQSRVESGLKVGQASDNSAIFSIAQKMRGDLSSMSKVSDNLSFGSAALGVAQSAATKISDQLNTLRSSVSQVGQSGIDQATLAQQAKAIMDNIDNFAASATYNGVNLLNNSGSLKVVSDTSGTILNTAGGDLRTSTGTGLGLGSLLQTGAGGAVTGFTAQNGSTLAFSGDYTASDADVFSVAVNQADGSTKNYVFELNDSGVDGTLTSATNANTELNSVNVTAGDSSTSVVSKLATAMQSAGLSASIDGSGNLVVNNGTVTATATTGTVTATNSPANSQALKLVDAAITKVTGFLSKIGSAINQVDGLKDFTSSLNDSLTEGLGALVDADLTEESAQLSSLQTKQQLATQSLSIANQGSQNLLSLFRG
ncbi:Flagellin [Roseomonas mucosa]|uniref:Flagellin n=2 Tax=Roseomonas mucosa TaxID=207340 RepID=A0A379N0X7_9PROT|nr:MULTISPECIES: flagellin [Roseomonas]MBS5902023.1 flagellin [Acetobacteraceae bacterium]ATR21128.1 flagellin [Roseomonas sp. FDAARGOS_362]AWV22293.1 Flagellin [Roseomonas mucosa]MCG7352099.1 flagellin [Roseomonas mucosa]MCG7355176.1 flagellin [Roseomonas mucosa]